MTSGDGEGLGLALTLGLGLALTEDDGLALALGVGEVDAEGALVGVGSTGSVVVGSLDGLADSSVASDEVGVALGSSSPVRGLSSLSDSAAGDGLAVSSSNAVLLGSDAGVSDGEGSDDGAGVVVDSTDGDALEDAVALGEASSLIVVGTHGSGTSVGICHRSVDSACAIGAGCSRAVAVNVAVDREETTMDAAAAQVTTARSIA